MIDVIECLNPSICHSLADCRNTIGSYYCSCKTGYKFASDRFTCVGKIVIILVFPK